MRRTAREKRDRMIAKRVEEARSWNRVDHGPPKLQGRVAPKVPKAQETDRAWDLAAQRIRAEVNRRGGLAYGEKAEIIRLLQTDVLKGVPDRTIRAHLDKALRGIKQHG